VQDFTIEPRPRHGRRSESEPYIEEGTFYSHDGERTYHVKRIDTGGGWSYVVAMEVVAKDAAKDILGRELADGMSTRDAWKEIWR